MPVPFSLAFDATKVPQVLEASMGYKTNIRGEYPKHLIDISGKKKEDVDAVLEGTSKEYGKITKATKVKITVVTFQNSPPWCEL